MNYDAEKLTCSQIKLIHRIIHTLLYSIQAQQEYCEVYHKKFDTTMKVTSVECKNYLSLALNDIKQLPDWVFGNSLEHLEDYLLNKPELWVIFQVITILSETAMDDGWIKSMK